jgi:hypothetical protein
MVDGVVPILHLTPTLGRLKRRRRYDDQKEIRVKIKNSRSNIDHVNGYVLSNVSGGIRLGGSLALPIFNDRR